MRNIAKQTIGLVTITTAACLLCGCVNTNGDLTKFLKPYESNTTTQEYRLQPPDKVTTQCARITEVNGKTQQIRPDGMISFEGLGELQAAGLTPKELALSIQKKAESLYSIKGDNPIIDVQVAAYNSSVYYVLGEVSMSGPKIYTGRDTVLTAIADAKLEVTGWAQKIRIIRPSPDGSGEAIIIAVDLHEMLNKGIMDRNVLLEEGDIVYVPATPLAAIAKVIEEFTRPIGRAFSPVSQYYQVQSYSGR